MEERTSITWSESAKTDLKSIFKYYSQFSTKVAEKLIEKIYETVSILTLPGFEKSGQVDECNNQFRRLICSNYKIFYKILVDEILIVRIFHTSQNPQRIAKIK